MLGSWPLCRPVSWVTRCPSSPDLPLIKQASELGHSLNENVLKPAQEKVTPPTPGVPCPPPEALIPGEQRVLGGFVQQFQLRPLGPHPWAL